MTDVHHSSVDSQPFLSPPIHNFFLGPIPGVLHNPLVILSWQLASCAFAWTFVTVLASRGQIPVSDATASLINRYQSETTFIATLIATILSTTTAWFFHAAVRQAVIPFLLRRVSLFRLCSAIEFSMGSLVLNKHHIRWTVSTILCIGLLGTLTSAWSSTISPITITLNLTVTGQEIDISTPAWLSYMVSATGQSPFVQTGSDLLSRNLNNVSLYDEEVANAGMSSATASILGNISILSYINSAFNISTGGIAAINNSMIPATVTWGSTTYDNVYPHVVPIDNEYYHGLSANQTLIQQGLTANVLCKSLDIADQTTYPFLVLSNMTGSSVKGQDNTWYMTPWSWNTTCSDTVSFVMNDVLTFSSVLWGPFLAGSVCPLQNFEGPSNQSFLIALQFIFPETHPYTQITGSQLCEVTPLLTMVRAEYAGGIINIAETLNNSTFDQIDPDGLMVYLLGRFVADQLFSSQASSILGNYILTRIYDFFSTQQTSLSDVDWSSFFAEYWRGHVEGYMTELRINTIFHLSSLSASEIPANISRQVDGTMHVVTKGWKFSKLGNLIALLPITATFIISMLALLFPTLPQHPRNSPQNDPDECVIFNPTSIVDIIRASAAGGLSDFFQGLRNAGVSDEDKDSQSLFIGLTDSANRIGFVESGTPSKPFIPYRRKAKK